MPPAKILIAAGVDEFEIVTVADRRAINQKVLQKNFVRRFLVVESEIVVFGVRRLVAAFPNGALPYGRANAPLVTPTRRGSVTEFEQSAFNFRHAAHYFNWTRRGRYRCGELIAEQMLDVVNQ